MAELDVKLDETTEGAEYHALAPAAVGSLVLGLLSPVALVGYLLWIVPALGIGLAFLALRAIGNSRGELVGRGTALTGLALSTLFLGAAPAQVLATRQRLAEAARPMADAYFEFLRQGEPQKALQLTVPQMQRRVLNDLLWNYYAESKENRAELEKFVASPVPRLILEYGEKCQARFYEISSVVPSSESDFVELIYAITYPDGDTKKSFFVAVKLERRVLQSGEVAWRILSAQGGYRPASLEE